MNYFKMIWNLWQLKRNEKKSVGEISALQVEKLKRLLHYAYEHSPYYRNSFYGASESLSMGVERNPQEGMLLFDEMNIVEVQDGVMYLTCLYNFVQPLIRYRLSDQLTLQKPDDSSRYPFTRAVGLLGRNEDILWFQDESGKKEFLHPLAVEGFCIKGLCDYQFRQISPDTFEMLAEVAKESLQETVQREILRQMREILREKGLEYVQFFVRFVPQILPDSQTGKKRLILASEGESL